MGDVQLIHFTEQQKLTQHGKTIILQLKKQMKVKDTLKFLHHLQADDSIPLKKKTNPFSLLIY